MRGWQETLWKEGADYDRFNKSYYIMKYSDYYNAWMRIGHGIKTISECKAIAEAYVNNQ